MAKALGIVAYNDSSVYVEGMQSYRPIAAFNLWDVSVWWISLCQT